MRDELCCSENDSWHIIGGEDASFSVHNHIHEMFNYTPDLYQIPSRDINHSGRVLVPVQGALINKQDSCSPTPHLVLAWARLKSCKRPGIGHPPQPDSPKQQLKHLSHNHGSANDEPLAQRSCLKSRGVVSNTLV